MIDHLIFPAEPAERLQSRTALEALCQGPHVVLETCDRLELYRGDGLWSPATARHLIRVASGLESPLPGEKAVLGQVRKAIADARAAGTCSAALDRLFQDAIAIARRVRQASGIDRGAIGHGQAACRLLEARGRPREAEMVLLIGANDLTRSLVRWLQSRHACSFVLANRSWEQACAMAGEFRIGAIPLQDFSRVLPQAGIVISATAAPHVIVHARQVPPRLPGEPERLFLDLAVPPDIDPAIGSIPGNQLWSIRDLEKAMAAMLAERHNVAALAAGIADRELSRVLAWKEKRWAS